MKHVGMGSLEKKKQKYKIFLSLQSHNMIFTVLCYNRNRNLLEASFPILNCDVFLDWEFLVQHCFILLGKNSKPHCSVNHINIKDNWYPMVHVFLSVYQSYMTELQLTLIPWSFFTTLLPIFFNIFIWLWAFVFLKIV